MGVKTYQAYTMTEALSAAKCDLGADAVILDTRSFKRGGLLGVGRRTIFELTATSVDRADLSRGNGKRAAQPTHAAARAAYRRTPAGAAPAAPRPPALAGAAAAPNLTHTRRLAQALAETHQRQARPGTAGPDTLVTPPRSPAPAPAPAATTALALRPPMPASTIEAGPAPVARRFILTPAGTASTASGSACEPTLPAEPARHTAPGTVTVVAPRDSNGSSDRTAMQEELSAIRTMVGQVLQRQAGSRKAAGASMPTDLFEMYLELVRQDLSEELADRIVNAVRRELGGRAREDRAAVRSAVARHLAELVPAADPVLDRASPEGRPLTIALIGPTGVGKTTTLAKLAATFKLKRNRKVGLVTCDTYRIAAVDQLRTYAEIIGLPLEVALTPDQVRHAVGALNDCDVVLIDTAGRGSNDRDRLDELIECVSAADPHEVHLVLSSTASERVLLREAEAFAAVGADRIVLTKLDEAVSFGVLINVMQTVGKQLSFMTTGQEVPDHIEIGRPLRLAELVLGGRLSA